MNFAQRILTANPHRGWLLGIIASIATVGPNISLGQDDLDDENGEQPVSLPLPAHPGRAPEAPEVTRPKESQPDRDKKPAIYTQTRKIGTMPVPGRPGRNLTPLKELNDVETEELESEEEVESDVEAAERLGLFRRLPHQLRDGGLNFEYIYTGETFTKARGGINPTRPTNYRSNFDLVGTIDTAKMGWWDNGRFFVYGQNLTGRPLSAAEVGDVQLFSNLDSTISATERPDFTTVAEYWYEHLTLDQRLRIKIGKQDANVDFALTDLGGDFVHSSYGVPPMIPLPTFPSQSLGIAAFLNLTDSLILGIGVFDGSLPSGPTGVRWGFDTLGHHGTMSLYQLEWKPQFQLPTTIRTGMWHHSENDVWIQLTTDPNPITYNQNYGFFTTFDQMIYKESYCEGNDQGLGVFGQFGWAPENRNFLKEFYGGGFVYKGLLPSRDNDLLGLGFSNVLFSGGFLQQNIAAGIPMAKYETAVELFYKYQFSQFITFQPDIQYIANPGGQYRDALVPGMRFEVVF